MEIADVVDEQSLNGYLEALPDDARSQTAHFVAMRAAGRVLPISLLAFVEELNGESGHLRALPLCNALMVSNVAFEILGIAEVVMAAESIASSAALFSGMTFAAAFSSATALAAGAEDKHAFAYDVESAAAKTVSNAANTTAGNKIWLEARRDLEIVEKNRQVPLWPETNMPQRIVDDWAATCKSLNSDNADWRFWIAFYNRLLDGKNIHADLLAPILSKLTQEDWLGDPALVNPLFDDVLAVYDAEDAAAIEAATPLGETVVYDDQQDLLVLRPLDRIQDDYLTTIHSQIASAVRVLNISGSGANAYQALSDEVAILNEAQTIHADRPVLIFKDVSRVLKRLERKIATGDCPSVTQDANIEDFQSILIDVQGELVGFNDEVRAYFNASRPPVSQEGKAIFITGANATLPQSDPALKDALESAIADLENSEEDVDAAKEAQYRIVGLLIRARKALKESAAFVKDASIVGGGVAAGAGTLAWFVSPAFREFVIAAMKAFGL